MDDYRNIINEELGGMTFAELKSRRSVTVKPKIKMKRIIAAAATVCAVMLFGITAAGGYIDFEAIFGNYIRVDNKELADSLLGKVSDVKYKVSDSDYQIAVKGAAGDKYNIIVIAEISRVDGTPVSEHFLIPCSEEFVSGLWIDAGLKLTPFNENSTTVKALGGKINESGNIELYMNVTSGGSIDGCKFYAAGENFYPFESLVGFFSENKVYYEYRNGSWGWYKKDDRGYAYNTPADVDDSAIKLLDLEWEFSFKYNVPETALEKKTCYDPAETFTFYQDTYSVVYEEMPDGSTRSYGDGSISFTVPNTAKVKLIEAEALGCKIEFEYPLNEYQREGRSGYSLSPSASNEIYLIKSDGTRITALHAESYSSGWGGDEIVDCRMSLSYTEDYSANILTEIADVTAIYINGTVYELS